MFLNHFSGGEKRQRLEVIGSIYRFMALTVKGYVRRQTGERMIPRCFKAIYIR